MAVIYFGAHDRVFVAIVLALVSTLCLETLQRPQQEIITESLCWVLILAGGAIYLHLYPSANQSKPRTPHSVNSFALCASLLCLSRSVRVMNWSLVSGHLRNSFFRLT